MYLNVGFTEGRNKIATENRKLILCIVSRLRPFDHILDYHPVAT